MHGPVGRAPPASGEAESPASSADRRTRFAIPRPRRDASGRGHPSARVRLGPRTSAPLPQPDPSPCSETRTSPAPAAALTRAAMWTARPPRSSPLTSTSPVWTPARICTPSDSIAPATSRAQRTACVGEANDAKKPSPVVATSRPPYRSSCTRTSAWCWSSRSRQRRSPHSAARVVESTMSVNSSVVSRRSGSLPVRVPVRNSSISSAMRSMPWEKIRWSSPGSSTSFAPSIPAATSSLCWIGTIRLPLRFITSVGHVIFGIVSSTSDVRVCR